MVYRPDDLSSCEKMILGCIYEYHKKAEDAPNLKDLIVIIFRKYGIEWKLQTLCTFLTRIEKKGLLTSTKRGRYKHYYPVVSHDVYVKYEMQEMCKVFFGNDMKAMKSFIRTM